MTPAGSGQAPAGWVGLTPRELLSAADEVLSDDGPDLAGRWPLAAAILCRQALEGAMLQLWLARAPGLQEATLRAQLLCLRDYVDRDLAYLVDHAWSSLTHACHHHAYELPPTAAELGRWFETVEALVRAVQPDP